MYGVVKQIRKEPAPLETDRTGSQSACDACIQQTELAPHGMKTDRISTLKMFIYGDTNGMKAQVTKRVTRRNRK
jgi:hypothetical protein